jgi:predicted AAA+ superfamily ATPase
MQTYIERDVRSIANIGSLQTFGRFFSILASLTACEFNAAHLGRELGIDRKTALAWAEMAEATFQWITVPAYSRNPVKRIAGKQKGYVTDTGFLCYLLRIPSAQAIQYHPLQGNLFETFVFMEIYKTVQQWPLKPNFYHFRTYGGAEVDLVLEFNGKVYLIEVKSTANPVKKHITGFRSFRACFPHEPIGGQFVICAVERPLKLDDQTWAIPWWML